GARLDTPLPLPGFLDPMRPAMRWRKTVISALGAVLLLAPVAASTQDGAVKIGVLDDMSGPYSDNTGPGDVLAVRMAVADFGGTALGKPIEIVSADMQNKVDVGVAIARRWFDNEQVDMIIGIPHSAIALAVVQLAEQKNRLVLPTAAATAELTGKSCSAHSAHWVYDTYGQSKTIANAIVRQGGDSWFFITVDYAFGLALDQNASGFYWCMSAGARTFTDRLAAAKGMPPTMIQAGTYGATLHYLRAVRAAGTDEAKAVMARMKELPINDFMARNGRIREDGRVIRDMYLMQAKTPEESKSEWDLAKIVATIPGEQAFRPLHEGGCPLVKK